MVRHERRRRPSGAKCARHGGALLRKYREDGDRIVAESCEVALDICRAKSTASSVPLDVKPFACRLHSGARPRSLMRRGGEVGRTAPRRHLERVERPFTRRRLRSIDSHRAATARLVFEMARDESPPNHRACKPPAARGDLRGSNATRTNPGSAVHDDAA